MPNKNRTEVSAAIQALSAIVGETEHKASLDDNFAQSVVFRKDVSDSETATTATKTLDFDGFDYILCAQSHAGVTYTLSNIQQGEIKYLKITKTAAQTISFAVATDVSQRKGYINESLTSVIYKITNKDGSLYVESLDVPPIYQIKELAIGNWNMNTTATFQVAHGLTAANIKKVTAFVVNDANNKTYNLSDGDVSVSNIAGSAIVNGANIDCTRGSGGVFDTSGFQTPPSSVRGWLIIEYVL